MRAGYLSALFLLKMSWRCVPIASKELQINDQIRDAQVRVIDADGAQLGLMSAREALQAAEAQAAKIKEHSTDSDPTLHPF